MENFLKFFAKILKFLVVRRRHGKFFVAKKFSTHPPHVVYSEVARRTGSEIRRFLLRGPQAVWWRGCTMEGMSSVPNPPNPQGVSLNARPILVPGAKLQGKNEELGPIGVEIRTFEVRISTPVRTN